jgi:hypothetical protein
MSCARIGIVVAALVLAASPSLAQEVGHLDLTDPAPRHRIRNPNGGQGGFCEGGGVSGVVIPDLTLTLMSVDKLAYSVGEDVTFEVKAENTSTHSIVIPWTLHLADLEPSDPTQPYTYLSAVVALRLTDPVSERFMERYVEFNGSTRVPGTIRELHPGQSIVIRARSKLEFYEEWWRKKISEVQPFPVKAEPDFMWNTMTYSPNDKGDSASEDTTCTPLITKRANQLDVLLWPQNAK